MHDEHSTVTAWLAARIPDEWFREPIEVVMDRDEITVTGTIAEPDRFDGAADANPRQARAGRIARFREETRSARMTIADEAEDCFGRKVAWAAICGGMRVDFTRMSVPVMTRLRQPERTVLDTLVAAGVARSRSEAIGWCVRLVGDHTDTWLTELREALTTVDDVRFRGPGV